MQGLTSSIFAGKYGLFTSVQKTLFLYIPLLTMGLMSREIASGSIKLLLSSPVKIRQIVIGKFLAIMAYGLLLVFILFLVAISSRYAIVSSDLGLIFCGIIGLYLLICAYAGIGLFMSSLTSYQLVAAISTFVVLAALNFAGDVWQDVDFIRHVTYFLSIAGRTEQFINGLISTKELFYFLIVIGIFIAFTIFVLQSQRESKHVALKAARYIVIISVALVIGYLSSRPSLIRYYDMTSGRRATLSENSQAVLKKLPQPLTVHTYVNVLDAQGMTVGMPAARNKDKEFFEPYQRFLSKEIKIDYTYFYDSLEKDNYIFFQNPGTPLNVLAENVADAQNFNFNNLLDSDAIRKSIDLRPRNNRYTREFVGGKGNSQLGLFADNGIVPDETEVITALKLLTVNKPRIVFLTGHNERSAFKMDDRDYDSRLTSITSRECLVNRGFSFSEILLDTVQNIPLDISALMIADPNLALNPSEIKKIEDYIAAGGNAMIAGEPGRQSMLSALVNPLGVKFMNGTLLRESEDFPPDLLVAFFSQEAAKYSKQLKALYADTAHLVTTGVMGLEYDANGPFHIEPFIITDKRNTWNRLGPINMDSGKIAFNPSLGDEKKTIPIAVTLTRKIRNKEQRIMVLGDADIFSNGQRSAVPKKNQELTAEMLRWFCYDQFPFDTERPSKLDKKMAIGHPGILMIRIFFLGIIPFILLIGGSLLLVRRRRA